MTSKHKTQSAADIAAENSRCEVMEEMDDDEGNERELNP